MGYFIKLKSSISISIIKKKKKKNKRKKILKRPKSIDKKESYSDFKSWLCPEY